MAHAGLVCVFGIAPGGSQIRTLTSREGCVPVTRVALRPAERANDTRVSHLIAPSSECSRLIRLTLNAEVSAAIQRATPEHASPQITASYAATNAEIAPSLHRNLSAGRRTPRSSGSDSSGMLYGDRSSYQLDFRTTKIFTVAGYRMQGMCWTSQSVHASPHPDAANPVRGRLADADTDSDRPTAKFKFQVDF